MPPAMVWSRAILPVMPSVDHLARLLGCISLEEGPKPWPGKPGSLPTSFHTKEFFPDQPGRGVVGGESTPLTAGPRRLRVPAPQCRRRPPYAHIQQYVVEIKPLQPHMLYAS